MIVSNPGIYGWYPSSACSRYYVWFVELGYPQLDITEYQDGSWDIIQYLNSPVVPSMTRFQTVLGNMKNIIPSPGFVEKYVKQIDTQRKEFWDREEAATRRVEEEDEARKRHAEDLAEKGRQAIMQNPDLVERIAKKGLQEMDIDKIRQHIPNSKF